MVGVRGKVSGPVLNVNAVEFDMGAATVNQDLVLTNVGQSTLSYLVQPTGGGVLPSWLTLTLDPARSSSTIAYLIIGINRRDLPVGDYQQSLTILTNGGDATVTIYMQVDGSAIILASPASLDFGTTIDTLDYTISNVGQGDLNWSISTADGSPLAAWITSITPSSGITGDAASTVHVAVSRAGLVAGTYSQTLQATSNGGTTTFTVSLTV